MTFRRQWILAAAAVLGFSGVLFAAAGSHWVTGLEDPGRYRQWQAAVLINLVHAVALLSISAITRAHESRLLAAGAILLLAGTVLFSGSIYTSMITGSSGPGAVAPAGGMAMLLGWLLLLGTAISKNPRS